jgi:hypothetical protein
VQLQVVFGETKDPFDYFEPTSKVSVYRKTYQHFSCPFSIENLDSDPRILPPILKNNVEGQKLKEFGRGHGKGGRKSAAHVVESGIQSILLVLPHR